MRIDEYLCMKSKPLTKEEVRLLQERIDKREEKYTTESILLDEADKEFMQTFYK